MDVKWVRDYLPELEARLRAGIPDETEWVEEVPRHDASPTGQVA